MGLVKNDRPLAQRKCRPLWVWWRTTGLWPNESAGPYGFGEERQAYRLCKWQRDRKQGLGTKLVVTNIIMSFYASNWTLITTEQEIQTINNNMLWLNHQSWCFIWEYCTWSSLDGGWTWVCFTIGCAYTRCGLPTGAGGLGGSDCSPDWPDFSLLVEREFVAVSDFLVFSASTELLLVCWVVA